MRILLVDDEPDIRMVARMSLERIGGHEVHVADGGEAALNVLESSSFDLLILDVMMPGARGPEVLARIRENGIETPAVFMTAKTQAAERAALLEAGAVAVIAKPFDPATLSGELEDAIA